MNVKIGKYENWKMRSSKAANNTNFCFLINEFINEGLEKYRRVWKKL